MGIGENFKDFCYQLRFRDALRTSIGNRRGRIVRQLNTDFRGTDSDSANCFYAGSYGRDTAIVPVSDLDLVYVLPYEVYVQYNGHVGNGQSALLQAVRASMRKTYPTSEITGDGQIVSVAFTDGITFEVLPAFLNKGGSYTHADSNGNGSWKLTNPKSEIEAIKNRDGTVNGNLVELCRMVRAWRDYNDVNISGILIDTIAYQFIENWHHRDKSYLYYDFLTRDFFQHLAAQSPDQQWWSAPGSGSRVYRKGNFEYKARQAELRAREAISYLQNEYDWSARQKFREIYGTGFPD